MSIGGIGGGSAAPDGLKPDGARGRDATSSGSGSSGSPHRGDSGVTTIVTASANGSITTTVTDAKGNVVSSSRSMFGRPGSTTVLDITA
ncbi:MAG: hypothetical protein ACRYG6_13980 [Janthinobacterium lividum]